MLIHSTFLLLTTLLLSPPEQQIGLEVTSLRRSDLPDDFPFQAIQNGFGIFQIRIHNQSSEAWSLQPEALQALDPKGKKLERALPTDITPKVMKFYTAGQRGIHGEGYSGQYGRAAVRHGRAPTVSPKSGPGIVSANQGQQIRAILEHYQISPVTILPGEDYQGLFYLKSKKVGNQLSGSTVDFGDGQITRVQ